MREDCEVAGVLAVLHLRQSVTFLELGHVDGVLVTSLDLLEGVSGADLAQVGLDWRLRPGCRTRDL